VLQRSPSETAIDGRAAEGNKAAESSAAAGASSDKGPGKAIEPGGATPVEVIELQPAAVQDDLDAVGSLRSNESVVLRLEVAGRIDKVGFRDGQPVRAAAFI